MPSTTTSELTDPQTGRTVGINSFSGENHPALATIATFTQPAAGVGVRNVCRSVSASIACGAAAQTPIIVALRDGASGAGAIIWSRALSAPVNQAGGVDITDLDIAGSPNTPMTLEFLTAGVAGSQETVALSGYLARQ